jgi:acyl-CoA synthetase (AMP-forming)/AMP-acid ligase II
MGLYHGARGVIAREFDPTKVLDFFEQSGITKLFMVPAAMQFVVRQPRARQVDFSRLKYMLYGASPIPAALLKECIEVFKCGFVQMSGMTETTGTIVALPPEDHIEGLDRMRSAGKALPGVELAILDADGNKLAPGEVGEIATRSGSNMAGYWNLPEATAKTLGRDGWLRTGDAGYMDNDGYLYIHDRIKDMIISGGENIYPAEVESAICDHPDVAEVAVVGVPDDKWGRGRQGDRGDEVWQVGDADRDHQLHPRTHCRLQDAENLRLHRGAATQRLGQDPAPPSARPLLGRHGSAGQLVAPQWSPRPGGRRRAAALLNASRPPCSRTKIPRPCASGFPRCPR